MPAATSTSGTGAKSSSLAGTVVLLPSYPVSGSTTRAAIEATPVNAYSGDYPLSRFLFVYVNYKPGTELDPLRAEFIRYIFSKDGQASVVKSGFYPILKPIADKALASVNLGDASPKPAEEKPPGTGGKQR